MGLVPRALVGTAAAVETVATLSEGDAMRKCELCGRHFQPVLKKQTTCPICIKHRIAKLEKRIAELKDELGPPEETS